MRFNLIPSPLRRLNLAFKDRILYVPQNKTRKTSMFIKFIFDVNSVRKQIILKAHPRGFIVGGASSTGEV